MKTATLQALRKDFAEAPFLMGGKVPLEEIQAAQAQVNIVFPSDYIEFVQEFGGAIVGPYPIFGLRTAKPMGRGDNSVVHMTRRFREWSVPHTESWLIISKDHAGNPIGLTSDGKVYIWDHDFRQKMQIADSFEHYLRKQCLKLEK